MYIDNGLYGFLLDENILFKIDSRKLLHYTEDSVEQSVFLKVISLNETQARLLIYLLIHRHNVIIDKNEILKSVWDEFNLSSSNQRLWQTINELRKKLTSVGLLYDLIVNERGLGYAIDSVKVKALRIY